MDTNSRVTLHENSRRRFMALLAAITCVTLLLVQSLAPERAHARPALAPEVVVNDFYGWYLTSLAKDKDPLTEDRTKLATYVSKALIKDIEREMKSADGIGEDYFLKSQDYLDEWHSARHVAKPTPTGRMSMVHITLGSSPENLRKLRLTMIREGGTWKIRRVISVKSGQ